MESFQSPVGLALPSLSPSYLWPGEVQHLRLQCAPCRQFSETAELFTIFKQMLKSDTVCIKKKNNPKTKKKTMLCIEILEKGKRKKIKKSNYPTLHHIDSC